MRIGIDGGCWNVKRGYGRFLRELLGAIERQGSKHEFVVFLDSEAYNSFHLGPPFTAIRVANTADVVSSASANGRRSLTDLIRMGWAVRQQQLDVFFFSSVYSWFPLLKGVPMVLGIHDTIADRNPQFSFASRTQHRLWQWKVTLALAQSDSILTVSEYSRRCIEEVLGVDPARIQVMYESASAIFRRLLDVPPPAIPFILYVGGISPNKNLAGLIHAYSKVRARKAGPLQLLLVGDYKSDSFCGNYSELSRIKEELSLGNEVVFTGYVPDQELVTLYNQASVFTMPSFDEGFGLPLIEAMACGAPVIASSGNSLEEVVGDAGLCVDPNDTDALALAIDSILLDQSYAASLRTRSMARAALFSWNSAAKTLIQILEETAHAHK